MVRNIEPTISIQSGAQYEIDKPMREKGYNYNK